MAGRGKPYLKSTCINHVEAIEPLPHFALQINCHYLSCCQSVYLSLFLSVCLSVYVCLSFNLSLSLSFSLSLPHLYGVSFRPNDHMVHII